MVMLAANSEVFAGVPWSLTVTVKKKTFGADDVFNDFTLVIIPVLPSTAK